MKKHTETFEVVVNNKPVPVTATAFTIATKEKRYRVSVNESPVYIYAWNDDLKRYSVLQTSQAATDIPDFVDEAIGEQLYSRMAA